MTHARRDASMVAIGWGLFYALTLSVTFAISSHAQAPPPPAEWRPFDGSWSATGKRETVPIEDGGTAAVARLAGAVVLTNGIGLVAGFTGEAIGFDNGRDLTTGRAVWTDGAGDRIFSTLSGGSLKAGRRVTGTITGGTGRWSGVAGEYELTWQYLVSADPETIQGRTTDLRGRLRWREGGR